VRPDVPWGLESIIRRCLAPDPDQRYQLAAHLAQDLRRLLADQPLRYAPELSLAERGRKWVRRHPRLASAGVVAAAAAVLLLGGGLALAGLSERLADQTERLAASQAQDAMRAYEAGTVRALCLVNTTSDLRDHLREGRAVCEQTLNLFGVLDRADWQDQDRWRRLAPEDRRRLAEDTRELLLLLAGARARLAPGDRDTLLAALELLKRAEEIPDLPPCRAIWEDRAAYHEQLGEHEAAAAARARAEATPAAGARDRYLLAMTHARAGRHDRAIEHLDEALRLNPRHYWSCMQRGLCNQERGDAAVAASDFGRCVGLWPEFAWGYFNRACALALCGMKKDAIDDYTAALGRDPDLVAAYLNRAMLRLELQQYEPALDDLGRAAALGRDDAVLHSGRGVALEGLGRHGEADEAFAAAAARADDVPWDVRLRLRWVYGFAVAARKPAPARAAFEEVLRESPDDPQALYGCAMLLDRAGRTEEALPYYDRSLQAAPDFEEARRFRALARARRGDFQAATQDMNVCLSRARGGATLYAAACVAALQARQAGPGAAGAEEQALNFLREAFARGYGQDRAGGDHDLDGIRRHPNFRALLDAARRDRR
jgi:tetratricopeptide (TPR) repeat protein